MSSISEYVKETENKIHFLEQKVSVLPASHKRQTSYIGEIMKDARSKLSVVATIGDDVCDGVKSDIDQMIESVRAQLNS